MSEEIVEPEKNYSIHAKMKTGQTRFVVLGVSPQNCLDLLPLAVSDWTRWDIQQLDEAWVARWCEDDLVWLPLSSPVVSKDLIRSLVLSKPQNHAPNFTIKDGDKC